MKTCKVLLTALLATSVAISVCRAGENAGAISAAEAATKVGETVTVNAIVVSTAYLAKSQGQPTFLNLDQPFPNNPLAVAIWGADRPKWSNPPEQWFKDKTITVTGKVTLWHGKPQIVVNDPAQISVVTRTSSAASSTVAARQ